MSITQRRTGGRQELDTLWGLVASLSLLVGFSTFDDGGIGDGTTAGRLRTNASVTFRIAGLAATKASTDNLWNLSAQTDTTASQYRAFWLYLDASGTASIGAGSNAASAADALKALPTPDGTKAIIGVFVADPSCNFDDAGGLAAQGTIHDGIPEGVPVGVPGKTYEKPDLVSLVNA